MIEPTLLGRLPLMFHLSDLLLQKPQYFFMFSAAQYILLAVFHPDEEAFFRAAYDR